MQVFRFGYQIAEGSADELRAQVRSAEAMGFDVAHTSDHVNASWSPLAPLMAMAECTQSIRICPLVLNNDFHHPVHLARELASIDHLSGGRLEVGLGAGHAFTEYASIGQRFDGPRTRKSRLAESVEIIRQLLDGHVVDFVGEHYQIEGARTQRSMQDHVPILIGVNGPTALSHAATHADTIGLTMLGRTLADGNRHEVHWQADRLDETVALIWERARERRETLELNALVQSVIVTSDRRSAGEDLASRVPGLSVDDALSTPFLAIGTHEQIADHLSACRERWGISYFSVRELGTFAPVIERLRSS